MARQKVHIRQIYGKTVVVGRSIIQEYLAAMMNNGFFDRGFYKWALTRGKTFGRLYRYQSDRMKKLIRQTRHSREIKQCYYNSQMAAVTANGRLDYYEGWYVTEHLPLPLEHGFNVYAGKVIDNTATGRFGVEEYFGIKIPLSFVRRNINDTSMAEPLLFKYFLSQMKNGNEQ
jgi:hypothetical protein